MADSTSLTPNATGSGRNKVALGPGRSLMDWIRLSNKTPNLSGTDGKYLSVKSVELAKHNSVDDAWISINGNVYNITPYLEFHPGGADELMRGAGIDATDLFNQTHKWVNYESMLKNCLVGKLVDPVVATKKKGGFALPSLSSFFGKNLVEGTDEQKPKISYSWSQDDCTVSIVVTSPDEKCLIAKENVVISLDGRRLRVRIRLSDDNYMFVHIELDGDVYLDTNVSVQKGQVLTVRLVKETSGVSWPCLGSPQEFDGELVSVKSSKSTYRLATLVNKENLTHDVRLLTLQLPKGHLMYVPIGQHVTLMMDVDGVGVARSYTPVLPAIDANPCVPCTTYRHLNGTEIHLMLKIYPGGALTPNIDSLEVGQSIQLGDPLGGFIISRYDNIKHLVLLAAGTGFTPMVRLLAWAFRPNSNIDVRLMTFHKTLKDIVWKEHLESIQADRRRFTMECVLSEADDSWQGKRGRVSVEHLKPFIPSGVKDEELLVCICGPPAFNRAAIASLGESGVSEKSVFLFEG